MSLRIFSVLSQNLLSQKKKKTAKEMREYGVKWRWFGGGRQKRTKCIVYQMLNLQ